jgi:spermidine/putrescine-binding protein
MPGISAIKRIVGQLVTTATLCACVALSVKADSLYILSPKDYISPDVLSAYEQEHDVTVHLTTYQSSLSRDTLLNSESDIFDVVIADEHKIVDLLNNENLAPLSEYLTVRNESVSNPMLQKRSMFLSHRQYGVLIDTSVLNIQTWDDFFQIPQAYKGRISIPLDYHTIFDIAIGKNNPDVKTVDLDAISTAGKKVWRHWRNMTPSVYQYGMKFDKQDQFVARVESHTMSRDAASLDGGFTFVIPSDKAIFTRRFAAIPTSAFSPDSAIDFIEYIARPDVRALQGLFNGEYIASNKRDEERYNINSHINININITPTYDLPDIRSESNEATMKKAYLFERIQNVQVR